MVYPFVPAENRRIKTGGGRGKNITVEVTFDRTPETASPPTTSPARQPRESAPQPPAPLQDEQNAHADASSSGWGGDTAGAALDEFPGVTDWAEEVEQEAGGVEQQQQQQVLDLQRQASDDWKNAPNISDWSEEVLREIPDSPQAAVPQTGKNRFSQLLTGQSEFFSRSTRLELPVPGCCRGGGASPANGSRATASLR